MLSQFEFKYGLINWFKDSRQLWARLWESCRPPTHQLNSSRRSHFTWREKSKASIVGCLWIAKQINSKLDFTFTVKTTTTSMTVLQFPWLPPSSYVRNTHQCWESLGDWFSSTMHGHQSTGRPKSINGLDNFRIRYIVIITLNQQLICYHGWLSHDW